MSSKSAIVFIDGNNWYHNVKSLISKPSDIDLTKLSYFIARHFKLEIVGIFYYNSVPDIRDGENMYYRHMVYLSSLEKEGIKVQTRKLQTNSTDELKNERVALINSLILCETCKPIVKQAFIDELGTIQKKEKGIDIMIAVDMIKKCMINKECDCCILISGDADFLPAMQIIKESGNEVITSSVYGGYSTELRKGKFRYKILSRKELTENCMKSFLDK